MDQEQARADPSGVGEGANMPLVAAAPAPGPTVRIALLGGFRLVVGGVPVPEGAWRLRKARSLVKLLALAPGQRLPRDEVMDALWPELDPAAAANNLRVALHAARRALLPHGAIDSLDGTLALQCAGGLWIDAVAFEEAAAIARAGGMLADYGRALDCYAGELLPEDRFEDWSVARRDYLRGLSLALLHDLAARYADEGDWSAAIITLQRLLVAEPTHERAHVALMRAYALAGQRPRALQQWDQLVATLRRELDADPDPAAQELHAAIVAGAFPSADRAAPAPRAARPRHNLPIPATALIGRDADLAAVKAALAAHRLVTLVGPGGGGKTRLALAAAADLLPAHPDGVWFVGLAPLAAPEQVLAAVAGAIGVRESPGRALREALVARLAERAALVVLDNCEHLRDACAELAAALVAAPVAADGSGVRLLATSRMPLGVAGELAWRVPSLRVPDAEVSERSPVALVAVPAVRLFVERVRQHQPAFALSERNGRAVAAITRRLDGIPLALELAAARANVLTAAQLAERLDDALGLLTSGDRAAPPRQQTLRATLEWSYRLLTPSQRALLDRLSVFAGGCALDAVEAVCAASPASVLDDLAALAAHSLVQVTTGDDAARYRLLETVRQFAAERLAADGEMAERQRRHAGHYLALAEREVELLSGAGQAAALAQLEREHDNLRAALGWALANGEAELGLRLGAALAPFWEARGYFAEGARWLDTLLALPGVEQVAPAVRAGVSFGSGMLSTRLGEHQRARSHFAEALAMARTLGDVRQAARALNALGMVASWSGDAAGALDHFGEATALLRAHGSSTTLANTLNSLGAIHMQLRRHDEAIRHCSEALALARAHHDRRTMARALSNLAASAHFLGDARGALAYAEEFLAFARELGDRYQLALGLNNVGGFRCHAADPAGALPFLHEALALRRELGDQPGIASTLAYLARCQFDLGDIAGATATGEEGLALARSVGARQGIADHLLLLGELAVAQGRPAQATFAVTEVLPAAQASEDWERVFEALDLAARVAVAHGDHDRSARILAAITAGRARAGLPTTARDARRAALLAADCEAALPPDAFAAAWAAGGGLRPDEAVALALARD
jgi:predicted ATPase/DNA-binding SARP family transcriptional activator